MTLKLYEAAEALAIIDEWVTEHADEIVNGGGALPPELDALFADASEQFQIKVERVALKIRELQGTSEAISAEVDRLSHRARALTNAATRLKAYLHAHMTAQGVTSVKGVLATVRVQNSTPRLVCDLDAQHAADDATLAPFVERREEWVLDRRALLDAIKSGSVQSPHARAEVGTHLRIT